MTTTEVTFVGTCVNLKAEDLWEYDDTERKIKYSTFRKWVGAETIKEINESVGVPVGKDWHVTFGRGLWKGKRAVCMHHSGIHHIWQV